MIIFWSTTGGNLDFKHEPWPISKRTKVTYVSHQRKIENQSSEQR